VGTYGFTHEALARSVLFLPPSEAHTQPLSETSVSALFGDGDLARATLINAWLDDGIRQMKKVPLGSSLKEALSARLKLNEPVLGHLPEVWI
jgi:ubiquinone biosynthesis protein COQ9